MLLAWRKIREALEQSVHFLLALLDMLAALVGDLKRFARTLARRFLDQSHVLEQGQGRIDYARARRIFAARKFLDGADEIITVARFVCDQLQQDEPKFAGLEHAAVPAPTPAPRPAFVAEVKVERTPTSMPTATAAHSDQGFGNIDLNSAARPAAIMPV
jgi:hypothetical protein